MHATDADIASEIITLAESATHRIRECGGDCDDAARTWRPILARLGLSDPTSPDRARLLGDALGDMSLAYDAASLGNWPSAAIYLRRALAGMEAANVIYK